MRRTREVAIALLLGGPLVLGLGSCSSCIGDVDVGSGGGGDTGAVQIVVGGLPTPTGSSIFLSATYDGARQGGDGTLHLVRTIEVTSAGQTDQPPAFTGLKTGTWDVTARIAEGGWSATCSGPVNKGATTTFRFTQGQAGCTTS